MAKVLALSLFLVTPLTLAQAARPKVYVPDRKVGVEVPIQTAYGPVVMTNGVNTGKIVRRHLEKGCPAVEVVKTPGVADYTVNVLDGRSGVAILDKRGAQVFMAEDTRNEAKQAKEVCSFFSH